MTAEMGFEPEVDLVGFYRLTRIAAMRDRGRNVQRRSHWTSVEAAEAWESGG